LALRTAYRLGRDEEDVRVVHQLERLEGAVRKRQAAEDEIDLAALELAEEFTVGRRS